MRQDNIITHQAYFLYPSVIFAHKDPHKITTILGSCVAVCLWDPVLKIGGINHFMLPLWNGQGLASPKYGNIAIDKLIKKMLELGGKKENLRAKIFGGGQRIQSSTTGMEIGKRNIILARQYLSDEKIPIVKTSVGGPMGRKIIFYSDTGDVMMKLIK